MEILGDSWRFLEILSVIVRSEWCSGILPQMLHDPGGILEGFLRDSWRILSSQVQQWGEGPSSWSYQSPVTNRPVRTRHLHSAVALLSVFCCDSGFRWHIRRGSGSDCGCHESILLEKGTQEENSWNMLKSPRLVRQAQRRFKPPASGFFLLNYWTCFLFSWDSGHPLTQLFSFSAVPVLFQGNSQLLSVQRCRRFGREPPQSLIPSVSVQFLSSFRAVSVQFS